jgi:predicted RNA methylase
MYFDVALSEQQIEELASLPTSAWFDHVRFSNAESPRHPNASEFERINKYKTEFVGDWIERVVRGSTVLDWFSANGRFAFHALEYGASRVQGVEFATERVQAARLIAKVVGVADRAAFVDGDVYEVRRLVDSSFDVVLCLGGLYHVADPPYVLRQLRALTESWLVVQTSHILPRRGNRAHFVVRDDMTAQGFTSIRGGSGVWYLTAGCFRRILSHAGFEIVEERQPPKRLRRSFPWFAALCKPI